MSNIKVILSISVICLLTNIALAQNKSDRMTFLIVIDNNHPWSDIINSKFEIKSKDGKIKLEIPFEYKVGKIICDDQIYDKLFNLKSEDTLYIKLMYRNLARDSDIFYEVKIDKKLLNTEFLILKIYNNYDRYSNERYIIPPDKGYVSQIIIPGTQTILNEKKR